jgi:hypothetical protein
MDTEWVWLGKMGVVSKIARTGSSEPGTRYLPFFKSLKVLVYSYFNAKPMLII